MVLSSVPTWRCPKFSYCIWNENKYANRSSIYFHIAKNRAAIHSSALKSCGRWDLNPHERNAHKILSLARLPVPTLPHDRISLGFFIFSLATSDSITKCSLYVNTFFQKFFLFFVSEIWLIFAYKTAQKKRNCNSQLRLTVMRKMGLEPTRAQCSQDP